MHHHTHKNSTEKTAGKFWFEQARPTPTSYAKGRIRDFVAKDCYPRERYVTD